VKHAWTLLVLLGVALAGCGGDAPAEEVAAVDAAGQATALHRIVFIDQEEACPCTRERIDVTWASLQEALSQRPEVAVERIFGDTQEELAQPYIAMKALVVAPGVYLLDEEGTLLTQLQGEQTAEQLTAAVR